MDVKGILTYDAETCRLCLAPQSGVIDITSSISSKSGKIIDMVRYCYDIEMVTHDTLPTLICNECALHLNVAYNLKEKCLISEMYFLNYLNAEVDSKPQVTVQPTPEYPPTLENLNEAASIETEAPEQKVAVPDDLPQFNTVEVARPTNDTETKYVRPNLLAYFTPNTHIELSDTDSETDDEVEVRSNTNNNNSKNYECPICPKRFTDLAAYNNHVRDHNKKVCKVCSRTCIGSNNIILHFRTHRPDQMIKCPHCDYASTSKLPVCQHIRKRHNVGSTFSVTNDNHKMQCNQCRSYFSSIEELRIHLHFDHSITVQNNSEASKYMKIVSNPKELNCSICHRQMKNSISLSLHMKLHQNNKLQYCYVCKLSFRNNMFLHFKVTHPGLPPYKCLDHCNETFTNKRFLVEHQKLVKKRRIEQTIVPTDQNSVLNGQSSSAQNKFPRLSLPSSNFNVPVPPIPPRGYAFIPVNQAKSFDCYVCDSVFDTEYQLNEHVEGHKIKKCKICYRVFGNFRALAGHFKIKHPVAENKDIYKCQDCGKTYDTFVALRKHQIQHLQNLHDTV